MTLDKIRFDEETTPVPSPLEGEEEITKAAINGETAIETEDDEPPDDGNDFDPRLGAPTIHRIFRLSAPQRRFCRAVLTGKPRYAAFVGGVGSGKTYAGCVSALNLSFAFPRNRGVIASGTERQLADTAQRQFFDLLAEQRLESRIVEHSKSEQRVLFHNGSEILFRSMEAYPRLLSLSLGWFWIDEASTVSPEGFKVLMSRLRLGGPRPMTGFVTSNPDMGWLKEVFHDKAWTDDVLLIRAATESNRRLPPDYAADLRRAFSGATARRWLDGEFTPLEGRVYDRFDPEIHVVRDFVPPDDWTHFRAIDFGYVNPFVCLFLAQAPDGRTVVYDEYVAAGRLLEEHAAEIHRRSEGRPPMAATYADHDAQDRAALAARGLVTRPARKELGAGIGCVVRSLGARVGGDPALRIDARCVRTLREIETYRWDAAHNGREAPLKENDHCMDALRYGLYSRSVEAASGPLMITAPRRRTPWMPR